MRCLVAHALVRAASALVPTPWLFLLSACAHYADFRLPDPGPQTNISYGWSARAEPVLRDGVDALNPSVVEFQGALWNFYSVFDGKSWHTAAAQSQDGTQWRLMGRVLSPASGSYIAANGSALVRQGTIWYWYQSGSPPRLRLARSGDGLHFQAEPQDVVELGPRGAWDERAVADVYLIERAVRM